LDWIRIAVADGLEGLLALRLKNTPAEDMIELTADIWVHAFARRVSVEGIDAPRIREGFMRIFPRIREWPAPLDVIELMPDRSPQPRLPAPEVSNEQWQRDQQRFDEILNGLLVHVSPGPRSHP
jgi:hypothetical protein